ncbi:hypothetical protein [Paraburkholderia phytofirmans]|uniref:hypothetical protein n=1 Tax=Paraburkholderia phytofirmans TaxID=261302 RepID=UPI0038BC7D1D
MITLLTRRSAYADNIAQPPCPKMKRQGKHHSRSETLSKKAEQKKAAAMLRLKHTHTALGALMRIVILQTPVGEYNQGFRMMVAIGQMYGCTISLGAAWVHH